MAVEFQNSASFFKPRYPDRYQPDNFKVVADGKVSGINSEHQAVFVKAKTKNGGDIYRVYAEVGAVFASDYWEEGGTKPKYTGTVTVNGEEQRLALWENHKDTIGKYLKGTVTDKQDAAAATPTPSVGISDDEDGIPF